MASLIGFLPFTIDVWITIAILSLTLNGILTVIVNKYWRLRNKMDSDVDGCLDKLKFLVSRQEVLDETIIVLENISNEINQIYKNKPEYINKLDEILKHVKKG